MFEYAQHHYPAGCHGNEYKGNAIIHVVDNKD
jgi:predicted deacylase